MDELAIVTTILSVVALMPLGAYLLLRWLYSPKIFIRVGGEQQDTDPIEIPEKGDVPFGITTGSKIKAFVSEVWVSFNDDEVDLSKTKGGGRRITTDSQFPLAILFSERRAVKRGYLQTNYFDYESKTDNFSVKISVRAEVDEAGLPFLLNMFPAPKVVSERIVNFRAVEGMAHDLKKLGLTIGPGESIQSEGVQSQESFWAVADKGIAQVKVREVIEDQ